MTQETESIVQVQAMPLSTGQKSEREPVEYPEIFWVGWHSDDAGLKQIYVNGEPVARTHTVRQRKVFVECKAGQTSVIHIVELDEDGKPLEPEVINLFQDEVYLHGCRVQLSWPRRGAIPLGSRVQIYWNGGDGDVDYGEALTELEVWPDPFGKWGFGLDGSGLGDFGYSGTGAVGWECGCFGLGEFGFDCDQQFYKSPVLEQGTYMFGIRTCDALGNIGGDSLEISFDVFPFPAAVKVTVEEYNAGQDELFLHIEEKGS